MDYCSSCRRHLNGALVCPGCGAYAPDIAPPQTAAPRPGGHATTPPAAPPTDDWFTTEHPSGSPGPDTAPSADVTDAPRAPQGRAARRRQLARWKKNQRRAVVATAVALVGGGITLASLDRGSGDKAQAATAPDNRSMGLTDEPSAAPSQPAPTSPAAGHRHTPATPTAHTSAVSVPRQQSAAPAPRTVQAAGRPHTAAVAPHPAATASPATPVVPQQRSTTTSSSGTDTGTGTTTNTGTSKGSSGTATQPAPSTGGGTSASSPSTPSPSQTSSSGQLCLVLLCLG
jgi:hypothetical protein